MMNSIPATYDTTTPLGKCFRGLDLILIWALVLIFIFMVSIVSAQVAMRYGFNVSIDWAEESGRLAFVWVVFLAIPLAASQGAHIGINLFVGQAVFKLPLSVLYSGILPFFVASLGALAVVTYVPDLSLYILRFL